MPLIPKPAPEPITDSGILNSGGMLNEGSVPAADGVALADPIPAPDTTGGPAAGNNPATIPQDVRAGLPAVDGTIDPNQFAAGEAVQSQVSQLAPPTDIDAATIGEYTPYDATLGEVDEASTVEGRLEGLLSKNSDYMQRAESKADMLSNRRGLLNSSMAVGAAQGAAIDAALPIAEQDASAFLEQQFLNQGYSNEAAKDLADQSVERQNLQAAFEQDTTLFNQTNTLENERLNQAAQNESNAAFTAETNKNNFATLTADLKSQLAQIDNELAMNLEELTSTFDILENLDSVNGSIYQQMISEMGDILAGEENVDTAQAKINNLLTAAGVEFAFSNGQEVGGTILSGNTGDSATDTIGGIGLGGGGDNTSTGGSSGSGTVSGQLSIMSAGDLAAITAASPIAGAIAATVNEVRKAINEDNPISPELSADLDELSEQLGITRAELDNMPMDDLTAMTEQALQDLAPTVADLFADTGGGGGNVPQGGGGADDQPGTSTAGGFGDAQQEADNPGSTGGGGGGSSGSGDASGAGGESDNTGGSF